MLSFNIKRRRFLQSSAAALTSPLLMKDITGLENDRHQKPFDGSDVDRIMTACDRQDSPGASVIVIKNGETIFKRSYGLAEVESRRPATTDTNYRLASVTKQFTAMCVLMLAERKKLSLHDPVARFFPKMPD